MPQIWATYEELAACFGKTQSEAREAVIAAGWPRRRCSDGLTRVKLTPALGAELARAHFAPAGRSGAEGRDAESARLHARLDAALADLAAERDRNAALMAELLRLTAQSALPTQISYRRTA